MELRSSKTIHLSGGRAMEFNVQRGSTSIEFRATVFHPIIKDDGWQKLTTSYRKYITTSYRKYPVMPDETRDNLIAALAANAFNLWSLGLRNQTTWTGLVNPQVGDWAMEITTIGRSGMHFEGIGEIIKIDHDGHGGEKVTLKLFDGNTQTWENAKFIKIPRTIIKYGRDGK